MAELRTDTPDQSVTTLVTGIINDAQELIRQQFALFRAEVHEDYRKTKEAAVSLAIGAGIAFLGAILLTFALPHLLFWAIPSVPLWAWYLMFGILLTGAGGGLIYGGLRRFDSFNPLPDQTMQAMRENVQWQTTPR